MVILMIIVIDAIIIIMGSHKSIDTLANYAIKLSKTFIIRMGTPRLGRSQQDVSIIAFPIATSKPTVASYYNVL